MSKVVLPVTVEIDIPVTRRTKIHAVVNGDGVQVYHSRRLSDVLEYLIDREVVAFEILDEDVAFQLTLRKPPPLSPTPKGPNHG